MVMSLAGLFFDVCGRLISSNILDYIMTNGMHESQHRTGVETDDC